MFSIANQLAPSSESSGFIRNDYYVFNRDNSDVNESLKNVTYTYFFSVKPNDNGELFYDGHSEDNFKLKFDDFFAKLDANQRSKMMLGVGNLDPIVTSASPETYRRFMNEMNRLLIDYGFVGLDIDWETDIAVSLYSNMIHNLRSWFPHKKISISIGSNNYNHYFDKAEAVDNIVDFINVQGYGPHTNNLSTVAVIDVLDQLNQNYGVDKNKLLLGLPIYAVTESQVEAGSPKDIAWSKLISDYGADPELNKFILGEYTYNYNSIPLIREKVSAVKAAGYRGVFTWEPQLDLPYGDVNSIIAAIDDEMIE